MVVTPLIPVPAPIARVDVRLVGFAYAALLSFAAISPRGSAAVLVLIGIMAVVANGLNRVAPPRWLSTDAWTLSVLAFAGLAAVSALWSPDPGIALGKAALLTLAVLAVNVAVVAIRRDAAAVLRAALIGVLITVAAAILLTVFETLSDQALTRKMLEIFPALQTGYDKHFRQLDGNVVWVSETNINRRTALVTLLFWPAACAVSLLLRGSLRVAVLVALLAAAVLLLWFTHHQSSQMALLAGAAALALYSVSRRAALPALGAAWTAAVLLMVPVALLTYQAELYKAPWVFQSARHRVVIWGYTAEQIVKRPVLGVGADQTAKLNLEREAVDVSKAGDTPYARSTSRHAHNAYLQVWYELGLVGAIAFLPIGLLALRAIGFMSNSVQPWAAALFAAAATMIAFSYSLWQVWFQAAFGLAVVALALVDALKRRLEANGSPIVPAA